MTLRFPTAAETDQGYAIQEAEMAARALNPLPREPRDQDLRDDAMPVRVATGVPCPQCGRVFDYATKGMTALQLKKHQRTAHPDDVEAY